MTLKELEKYDGENGRPAYIACNGKIYDVTESEYWKDGLHMKRHSAGEDLTNAISRSPHGEYILERMKVVGHITE